MISDVETFFCVHNMMTPHKYLYYELRGQTSVTLIVILKNTKHHNYLINLAEPILLLSQQYLSQTYTLTTKTTSKL